MPGDESSTVGAGGAVCEGLKELDGFEEVIFCCFSADIAEHHRAALARHAL